MKNKISGLLFFLFGIFFSIHSSNYTIGTFDDMGPGFMPLVFSVILLFLGIVLLMKKDDR